MLRKQPASLKQIAAYLAKEEELQGYKLTVSAGTFERDLEEIFKLYQFEIKYHPSKKV